MVILGHKISGKAEKFIKKKAKLLGKIEFRDISNHPNLAARRLDGCHDFDGEKYIVWLKPSCSEFEQFMMHEIMHGVLIGEGFPQTGRLRNLPFQDDQKAQEIGSLLSSIILDLIIDPRLFKSGLTYFNRESAVRSKIIEAINDSSNEQIVPYNIFFCKWILLYVITGLDSFLTEKQREDLFSCITNTMPDVARLGKSLCEEIKKKGFLTPQKALNAMIILRNSLKLNESVFIVDSQGRSY